MNIPENIKFKRRTRHIIILFCYSIILLAFFLLCCEIILRLKGVKPYKPVELSVKIEPGEKLFCPDPDVGYTHLGGKFRVTLKDCYTFELTHTANGLRITRPINDNKTRKNSIWIMGCSFTHGWSLNDDQTYPWLIQKKLTNYDVLNFGVNGYGTVQSLVQFRKFLKQSKKPAVVVATYAYFHDERNTFLRSWRKAIVPYNKLGQVAPPYARLDQNSKLVFFRNPVQYTEFPLQRISALMHFIEQKYDDYEDINIKSHFVTKAVIETFANECKTNGIDFVLASITRGKINSDVIEFCKSKGIKAVDISVSLSEPANRNLPYDDHPSAIAHKQYADKLLNYLENNVLKD